MLLSMTLNALKVTLLMTAFLLLGCGAFNTVWCGFEWMVNQNCDQSKRVAEPPPEFKATDDEYIVSCRTAAENCGGTTRAIQQPFCAKKEEDAMANAKSRCEEFVVEEGCDEGSVCTCEVTDIDDDSCIAPL